MGVIQEGDTLRLPGVGERWRVGGSLGEGGQGLVFALHGEESGSLLALKWYSERAANAQQRDAILKLIARGSPGRSFLWPEHLVDGDGATFGYVMPVRPAGYRHIIDLLLGKVDGPPSLNLQLCIELATAFLQLHAEGLCYRDISFGNIFFEPATGRVLVCDNDNVGIDGESYSGVMGTRRFMAPEVIRGEALPSMETDLHSLAVLIFYLIAFHHPLIGRREAIHRRREGETLLLGDDPVFIFDPDNPENRPDPLTQPAPIARWARYPAPVRVLFEQAFTVGLRVPSRRVRESVWRTTLSRLRDDITVCGYCGDETFAVSDPTATCPGCHRKLEPPIRLRGDGVALVLNDGTAVCRHHVYRDFDYSTRLGTVVRDPSRGLWGIRNDDSQPWRVAAPGNETRIVEPGRTVALVKDCRIRIANAELRVTVD